MRKAQSLHNSAMQLIDQALAARNASRLQEATALFETALVRESAAARLTRAQPSRAILFRSAAHIALECQALEAAEQLACMGLIGTPPSDIAEELRHVLDRATFSRHLRLDGIQLSPTSVQLAIAGPSIGFGDAPEPEIMSRVEAYRKLVGRAANRKRGIPYSDNSFGHGDDDFRLFMSTPRAASFAVTLRVGAREAQGHLEFDVDGESVVEDVMVNLSAFENNDMGKLRSAIPEVEYQRNFIALARRLAPDGKRVTTVGLTRTRIDQNEQIALRRPRADHQLSRSAKTPVVTETLEGRLDLADGRNDMKTIGKIILTTSSGEVKIAVPKGVLADIVRPHFQQHVAIRAKKLRGGAYKFIDFV